MRALITDRKKNIAIVAHLTFAVLRIKGKIILEFQQVLMTPII